MHAVCGISVVPALEGEAVGGDCVGDGSDRKCLAGEAHLPGVLLGGNAGVNCLEDGVDVHESCLVPVGRWVTPVGSCGYLPCPLDGLPLHHHFVAGGPLRSDAPYQGHHCCSHFQLPHFQVWKGW